MKHLKLVAFFLALVILNACSKDSAETADLGTKIEGTYKVNSITQGTTTITEDIIKLAGGTATVKITRKTSTSAIFLLEVVLGTQKNTSSGDVNLEDAGNGVVRLKDPLDVTAAGTITNGKMEFSGMDKDTKTLVKIVATKQ